MFILWALFLSLWLFALSENCSCVPLGVSCLDGFSSTCKPTTICDSLYITSDFIMLDECLLIHNTYLEIQSKEIPITIVIDDEISFSFIGGYIHEQSYVNLVGNYLKEIQPKILLQSNSSLTYYYLNERDITNNILKLIEYQLINDQSKYQFIKTALDSYISLNYTELSITQNEPVFIEAIAIEFIDVNDKIYLEEQNQIFCFYCNSYSLSLQFNQLNFALFNSFGFVWDDTYFIIVNDSTIKCIDNIIDTNCQEGFYYDVDLGECMFCNDFCQRCLSTIECILCSDGYYPNNGSCIEKDSNCEYMKNGVCKKCNDGYYISNELCLKCDNDCISCNETYCYICNFTLNYDGECITDQYDIEIMTNNDIISCKNGMINTNEMSCIYCNETFPHCIDCDQKNCYKCENGYQLTNEFQCISNHCIDDNCEECLNGYQKDQNGQCVEKISDCLIILNGKCLKCINESYLYNGECISTLPYCSIPTNIGCLRCLDGCYLNEEMQCSLCSKNCLSCLNTEDTCLSCSDDYILGEDNICRSIETLFLNCIDFDKESRMCVGCDNGYYPKDGYCEACSENCFNCSSGTTCLTCENDYYLTSTKDCLLKSSIVGCSSNITKNGCSSCSDGYYLNHNICIECNTTCETCTSTYDCTSCVDDYVLKSNKCIYYKEINHCYSAQYSECTSCDFWYAPSEDRSLCVTSIEWWLVFVVVIAAVLIVCIVAPLTYFIFLTKEEIIKKNEQRRFAAVFPMKYSNVKFINTENKCIFVNKRTITFSDNESGDGEQIEVNKESKDLICIGNATKRSIRVQLSVKKGSDKYELRTTQYAVHLKKGMACEFEIFIKPLCTCTIKDYVVIISKTLHNNEDKTLCLKVDTQTKMTTRLDYSELIEDEKIGEGSFGIVYKGKFRGNQVAIKKMKSFISNNKQIKEFEKEVTMLDKFRSPFIIQFYGAVFIPNKICIVMEYSKYGSLHDLMNKTQPGTLTLLTRLLILIDAAKGIHYLHSNGILHRDIKPDNIIVVSLENDVEMHSKLTDFGSSRNINLLMTNMTFTKGIGTPSYMAPEILFKRKYKKPADIYSFAISMYECFIWGDPYKNVFEYPWELADFIAKGNRLKKPEGMCSYTHELITDCWKQNPSERIEIKEVIERLEYMRYCDNKKYHQIYQSHQFQINQNKCEFI